MTKIDRDQTPADLAWVAERLEQERPTANPLELDRMKLQARTQAMRGARSQLKGSALKSRVAIIGLLMLGLLTGGTGTTLALSEDTGSAAQKQYPGDVRGDTQQGGGDRGGGQVLGDTASGGDTVQPSGDTVEASQQVATTGGGSDLPFTGLAAVPMIMLGLALVGAGGLLHRSARREEPSGL